MTLDPQACRDLAVDMVDSAVDDLKRNHHPREIDFFTDPAKSELWIVTAGLDYDAVVSRLRHDGHFTPAPPKISRKFLRSSY